MKHLAVLLALTLLTGCSEAAPPRGGASAFDDAERAAFNSEYAKAKPLYAAAMRDDPSDEHRDKAAIRLANIAWRIDGDDAAAVKLLQPIAERESTQRVAALLEWARLRERTSYAEALALARRARALAKRDDDVRAATLAIARVIVDEHLEARHARPAAPGSDVREAIALVEPLVKAEPGRLRPSLALLDAALLAGDGAVALEAWQSYYGATAASPLLRDAASTLARVLPAWRGGENRDLIDALAASRLFTEAVLVMQNRSAFPELVAYEAFLRELRKTTESYYRDVARGHGDARTYKNAYHDALRGVWQATLHRSPDEKALDDVDTPLGQRFGFYGNLGQTGGVTDLHAGHRVVDERRTVEQYGRSSDIRFVLLDNMLSNGFETWSRDGRAQHGGWGGSGFIVQVRPAYAEGPVNTWRTLTNPELRKKRDDEIAKETEEDWRRATANPYAYLPGLAQRMQRDAEQRLYDAVHGDRVAFLAQLGRHIEDSSIFAHEARHAIDAKYARQEKTKLSGADLEFRAKLSEIAFAPDPKLTLTTGILAPNIGDDSPHGQANLRVMKGLVAWMQSHRNEIAGLDAARPLLPQLDRMSDEQLRAAARGMDPYAR